MNTHSLAKRQAKVNESFKFLIEYEKNEIKNIKKYVFL